MKQVLFIKKNGESARFWLNSQKDAISLLINYLKNEEDLEEFAQISLLNE